MPALLLLMQLLTGKIRRKSKESIYQELDFESQRYTLVQKSRLVLQNTRSKYFRLIFMIISERNLHCTIRYTENIPLLYCNRIFLTTIFFFQSLTHLSPMYPFFPAENIRKPQGFLIFSGVQKMFSGGRERMLWEQKC